MSRTIFRLGVVLFVAAALLPVTETARADSGAHFKKVVIVVLENTNYDEGVRQPFLASLISRGALLSNFTAESHPSQPNYIALISGSTQGVFSDFNANLGAQHIGDLLEAKGLQWKAYAENYPGNCYQGSSSGLYARKHVPFISFRNIQEDAARCARIVDASQFDADLASGSLPDFSFYSPNLQNDGHNTTPAFADKWLSTKFGPLLQDKRFKQDMLFVVTFDESETIIGNHILTVLYGDSIRPGSVSAIPYSHYSILRTIEEELGLGNLGLGDTTANAINEVWK